MQFPKPISAKELGEIFGYKVLGNENAMAEGINEIHVLNDGDVAFVDHPKYFEKTLQSKAGIILINKETEVPEGKALLICEEPFTEFVRILKTYRPFEKATALISPSASIGEGTIIQPGAFIGNHVVIGKNCLIHSNASIYDYSVLGDNVTIHANAVIGGDGFYYKKRPDHFEKLYSAGRVVLGDFVEIGAGTTIDKGVTGDTTIGKHTKIDNQVQIGHDTQVGERCLLASQVGIAGAVVIEDEVTMWGQVGCTSGVTVGKGATIGAKSGISKSLEGGKTYFGAPAMELRQYYKQLANLRKLD